MSHPVQRPYGDPSRPLVVCDIDEVVLEFVAPFTQFLDAGGYSLAGESFRLHGNVRHATSGEVAPDEAVSALIEDFFATQGAWQTPVAGARAALDSLAAKADIVFLSAMPERHATVRRALLDAHDFASFPLIASELPKGAIVAELRGASDRVAMFIDDLPHNHAAVRRDAPGVHCIHLMASDQFRALLPPLPPGVHVASDWPHAVRIIDSLVSR